MSLDLPLPQVLAVDDNAANLLALEAMLAPLEHVLVKAQSGAGALREVLRHEFALILLDVQMEGLDGFATAELIRARTRSRHIPIMFITAKDRDQRLVTRGYNVGAVDYIQKPVDPEILRSKVRVFLELYRKNAIIAWQAERIRQASQRELADQRRQSEDRYRTLADSMPQLVWTADAQGVLRYENRRWIECAAADVAEPHFAHVVHPEDLPAFVQRWTEAVRAGQAFSGEYRFAAPNRNGFRWHLVRAGPELDKDGQVTGWVGTSTDIDDRKRAEDALRVLASTSQKLGSTLGTEAGLQDALESTLPLLGDAALLNLRTEARGGTRLRAVAVGVSVPLLEDLRFGLGADTVVFTGRPEIYLDVARELADARSRRADPESMRTLEQLQFLHELGVVSYMCLPLSSRDRVLGALSYFTVDSRRRHTSESVALASDLARRFAAALDNLRLYEIASSERAKHEEVSRAKDVFLATLSHELRTPLNAVLGWIQLIRSGALSEDKLDHAVQTVDRNARALERLLVDLLDVSRIVAGNLSVELVDVDISGVVSSAVDAARPAAQAKEITLVVDAPASTGVSGDAGRLHQVVSNLLTNAIKFTPQGGTVQVRLERDDEWARLLVIDSGEGIPREFLPHVFDHFRQAHSESTRAAGGLGLGLAIVKHLVELHGGKVSARSGGAGQGSTFSVELPLRPSADIAEPRTSSDPAPASGPRHKNLAGVHALVVEDDDDGRELLRTVLNGYGAIVTTVGTARAALAAIAERPPDVLISDIGLPDEDGFALIQKVRADGHSGLPAIAVTAYVSPSDVGRAFGAGFQAHLPKPIQPTALGAAVARLVGR